jgi:hypothetical protein
VTAEELAQEFHETYERLAPQFGYETREETREFDPCSPNGRLMIAVCGEVIVQARERANAAEVEISRLKEAMGAERDQRAADVVRLKKDMGSLRAAWNAHMERCTLDAEIQAEINALVPTFDQIHEWKNAPTGSTAALRDAQESEGLEGDSQGHSSDPRSPSGPERERAAPSVESPSGSSTQESEGREG